MPRDLSRLFAPNSVAIVGGSAWSKSVIEQCQKIRFPGQIWPVHPKAEHISGLPAFASINALPTAPDACFIGVNRFATIDIVQALSKRRAGGAVCFASGFQEAQAEDAQGTDLQAQLLDAAGDMPILGPNCYGFINYLDGALLWPDQHGGSQTETGVALVTQSSNIAINLTMQTRAVPIAYVVTAGNQAQCGISEIGMALLDDPRVTVLGLHIEGIGDLDAFQNLAHHARQINKPIVALKIGKSSQARCATVSHTASLSGDDTGADALLKRLGILRVHDLTSFLETLKLLHITGRLAKNTVATISCSGGEASLAADIGQDLNIVFPELNDSQKTLLRDTLGPMVALANPLDYHTYIWRNPDAMTQTFFAMIDPEIAITVLIVDFPRADRCDPKDWDCTVEAAIAVRKKTSANIAMAATLPELMPETVATRLMNAGVVPFCGLTEALTAIAVSAQPIPAEPPRLIPPSQCANTDCKLISEAKAKRALALHGLNIPISKIVSSPIQAAQAATQLGFPVVLKGEGLAHKTEAGAVVLNLQTPADVQNCAQSMPCSSFLVEQMINDVCAEILIGVVHDPAHGFVLTLGAGGTLTEVQNDTASVLLPATDEMITDALETLRIAPILRGFRGKPGVYMPSVLTAIHAIQSYVKAHSSSLSEIEINPLLCTSSHAIAADALIRQKD